MHGDVAGQQGGGGLPGLWLGRGRYCKGIGLRHVAPKLYKHGPAAAALRAVHGHAHLQVRGKIGGQQERLPARRGSELHAELTKQCTR